jgi:hypothetical protein
MVKHTHDVFVEVVARAIEANPQTLAAVKEIVSREWNAADEGAPWGIDLDRHWRIGGAITDALHLSIGHPGGGEPEDVRWEYTILMNLIYHVGDAELGLYCIEHYAPETP